MRALLFWLITICLSVAARADLLSPAQIEPFVKPPLLLGEKFDSSEVYRLVDVYGAEAGYVFETEPLAPLPGFSGAPINLLVQLDRAGNFIDVDLIEQNEPIFVSGLGVAPFKAFLEQYKGLNIASPMVVGTPYGNSGSESSSLVYLDGVTKATASVRIAHESILAATLAVARDKMQGLKIGQPSRPDPEHQEDLDWVALVNLGIASHHVVTNEQVQAAFSETLWADDDPLAKAEPDAHYIDLWIIDIGPRSIAAAVLSPQTLQELGDFLTLSPHDEPLLLIETARHGLVDEDFVRNTAPDLLTAQQGGLPVALRDADLFVELAPELPQGAAMILRADRRLGFDPASEWILSLKVLREHGSFRPVIGSAEFTAQHSTPGRFFITPQSPGNKPAWRAALEHRLPDVLVLLLFLAVLLPILLFRQSWLAGLRLFTPIRLGVLAFVLGFIGWWGQGQLSIVTPLATLHTITTGGSLTFLAYDPFSLVIWLAALLGFFLWGRGLFCGWLCPFGAFQEFAHHLGRRLGLRQWNLPDQWDKRMKWLKHAMLLGLVLVAVLAPDQIDTAVEIEPFKTAITSYFLREWTYTAYAVSLVLIGMISFKSFCRYLCPLGALMAIAGLLRLRNWIPRRPECGSPCQLCRVRCQYGAIRPSGKIDFDECFQCLDCVTIHDTTKLCVPLVLKARGNTRIRSALETSQPRQG
ncbi:4Fe-4S binding protein [Ruegeria sp. WL0004]|uniref:4Fe-4S binding protein n=1 Tax=Ruegeria marisflavi TaxID=2984152 RepID=A0ABT2WXK8_9RHOB|nr:4Fe-4S binding protein [Ruegeria sp. WL0004]MCU9839755.1 4Fe-4S binding protein [Ruegeria sp. WL0004]